LRRSDDQAIRDAAREVGVSMMTEYRTKSELV